MLKHCNGPCKLDKPFDAFHKGNGKFGLASRCVECVKVYAPHSKEYRQQYYKDNIIKSRESRRQYRHRHKLRCNVYNKEYDKNHKSERAARESLRRAKKLKATPPWLTKVDIMAIQAIYVERDRLSAEKGIIYHVDHIVPLVSDIVCGFHVPWNLQIVPAQDNLQKGNKVLL